MIERMPGLKSEDLGLSSGLKKTNGSASCFPDLWEEMKEAYVLGTRGEPGTCDVGTHQVPLSMGFSRQVCWSGLPFSSPGDIPDPGIEPTPPVLAGRFFTIEPSGKSLDTETSLVFKNQ